MKDGRGLRAVKALIRGGVLFDLRVARGLYRLRGRTWYDLGGECRRCARCCEAPAIAVGALVWHWPRLRHAFLWWQERVNGFVLMRARRESRTFVFRCTHFDWKTRSCDSYGSRPAVCRDYPRALLFQPDPAMLPGCGHRPIDRNAPALLGVLDAHALSPGQREKVEKGLHLR